MNKKLFALLALCVLTGMAAAFLSLAVSLFFVSLLEKLPENQLLETASLVILEEISKFAFIWLIFYLIADNLSFLKSLAFSFFLSAGFSLFEAALIFAGTTPLNFTILGIFAVHSFSFFFWIWGLFFFKIRKNPLALGIFSLIIVFFHLIYNLFALNNF